MITILINYNPWTQHSASSNRWLTLIHGLAALQVEVRTIIYGGYSSKNEIDAWGQQGNYNNVSYEYVLPIIVEGYWKVRFYNYLGQYFNKNKVINRLSKALIGTKDIIWTDTTLLGFELAYILKKQNPQRILFTEMSEFLDIHLYNKGNFLQRFIDNRRQRFFEQKAYHIYDGMALMTKTLIRHYKSFPLPHPVLLHLPMTVDLERFDTKFNPLPEFKKPFIAFVGVMNDAKDGVSILIQAFQKICDKYPLYNLYLVGPWNYDTPFHLSLINEFHLTDRVFWMKGYPRDQIPVIISHADILVLPRPNSKQAQGGFPTKLGEYLATGNPVCSTRVGEIPDYLVDNESVFFADPGSVDSFACSLDRALSNPQNASIVGKNGRHIAEKEFNKDVQTRKLYEFLCCLNERNN